MNSAGIVEAEGPKRGTPFAVDDSNTAGSLKPIVACVISLGCFKRVVEKSCPPDFELFCWSRRVSASSGLILLYNGQINCSRDRHSRRTEKRREGATQNSPDFSSLANTCKGGWSASQYQIAFTPIHTYAQHSRQCLPMQEYQVSR